MTEPTEPTEPSEPTEPTEPQEESADEAEEHDEDNLPEHEREPGDEPQGPGPPEQSEAVSEQEIEKAHKALAAEATRHANRVSQILGEAAQELLPCELCWPSAPGFRFPQMPDEQRDAVMVAIGFATEAELEEDKSASQCPDCKGWGEVRTGSRVQGNAVMRCTACDGVGAVGARFAAETGLPPQPSPLAATNGPPADAPLDANRERLKREARAAGLMITDPFERATT